MNRIRRKIKDLLEEINSFSDKRIGVILPDGAKLGAPAEIWVQVKDWKVLLDVLKDPELGFAENYMYGNLEVTGDLETLLVAGNRYVRFIESKKMRNYSLFGRIAGLLACLFDSLRGVFSKINVEKEKRDVQYHYDLGNDFYKLWLDESLTYSCAFFEDPSWSIEQAQSEKRRIIYEKLLLKEGDTLLDIGCGWGSIVIESAKSYDLRAIGITLSEEQYNYVKERIREEGLEGKADVYLMHYADLPKLGLKFDKIVSVGMFEHVGKGNIRRFFEVVSGLLKEGGLFLLHTIGKEFEGQTSRFMTKYIFPGGYLPYLGEIIAKTEGLNLCLLDIDDWRIHYYFTLKRWRERFLEHLDSVKEKYGEVFARMWYFYLTTSMSAFRAGNTHVFQILFSKGVKNDYPVIRRKLIPLIPPGHLQ